MSETPKPDRKLTREEAIRLVVDAAPPLNEHQRATIKALLGKPAPR